MVEKIGGVGFAGKKEADEPRLFARHGRWSNRLNANLTEIAIIFHNYRLAMIEKL